LYDGYRWANGSRKSIKVTWKMKQRRIAAPKAKSFKYNGKKRVAVKSGKWYSVSGTASAKKVGTYTAYVSPNYGCTWKNGKTNTIALKWKIKRR